MKTLRIHKTFLLLAAFLLAWAWGPAAVANQPATDPNSKGNGDSDLKKTESRDPLCGGDQAGNKGATNQCVSLVVKFGRTPHNPDASIGGLFIRQDRPSPVLFTPQGLHYSQFAQTRILKVETTGLPTGIARAVTIARPNGYTVTYHFRTGESLGYPIGTQAGFNSRLQMLDAAGVATTTAPVFYERLYGEGGTIRYDASTLKMVKVVGNAGKTYTEDDIGIEVLRDGSGWLRQIRSECDGLADIVVLTAGVSYEIRLYAPSQVGTKGPDGLYTVTGTAHTVWRIENPASNPTSSEKYDRVRATETCGSRTTANEWVYNQSADDWELSEGSGARYTRKTLSGDATRTYIQALTEIAESNRSVVSRELEVTRIFPWGEAAVLTTIDPGGLNLTTSKDYYNVATETGRYSQLRAETFADGSWTAYDYDTQGRKSLEVSPWQNNAFDTAQTSTQLAAVNSAVYYSYVAVDPADVIGANDNRPRTVEAKVNGITTRKVYNAYKTNAAGERIEITEVCVNPSAAYGAATNLRAVSTFYAATDTNTAAATRLKSVVRPDGTMDTFTYEAGAYAPPASSSSPGVFTPAAAGKALRTTAVHGTTANPAGIAFKTLKEVVVEDEFDNPVMTESHACTGSGQYELVNWSVKTFDALHNVTAAATSGNLVASAEWNGDRKTAETAPDGSRTEFGYDALGRIVSRTKKGVGDIPDVTTAITYDAADRILSESVSGGSLSLLSANEYDRAGRLLRTTDAAGLVTAWAYDLDGRRVTTTLPGGATRIVEARRDGSLATLSGTAVVPETYEHGVNADGTCWTRAYTGPAGVNSPMWSKSTLDLAGRLVRNESPASGNPANLLPSDPNFKFQISTLSYNSLGQRVKSEVRDHQNNLLTAPTLVEYNELGSAFRTGLDVNFTNTLNLTSSDRIAESETSFEKDAQNLWWAKSLSKTYPTAGSDTAVTVSTSRIQLSGLGGAVDGEPGFLLAVRAKSADVHGNETVAQTLINPSTHTTKTITTVPTSSQPAVAVAVNGRKLSETSVSGITTQYQYDALGRQTAVVDARTGTSSLHWNSKGQVDYVQDAAGFQTTFTYDAATGRRTVVENALGKKAYTDYNLRGQVVHTWGDTAYPTEVVYDDFGRQSQLKTFRAGSGWEGAAWPAATTGTADVTAWNYEAATGLLLAKTDAANKATAYTYDLAGRLATRTWARLPGSQALTTTYAYAAATGELVNVDYSDATPDVTYAYDRLGRTASVVDVTGTRTFTYSATDLQLTAENLPAAFYGERALAPHYDAIGRNDGFSLAVIGAAAPERNHTYTFDPYGRTSTLTVSILQTPPATPPQFQISNFQYQYLANSDLLASITFPNGLVTTKAYETNRDLLAAVQNNVGQTLLSGFAYANNAIASRTAVTRSGSAFAATDTIAYAYNDRNELITASSSLAAQNLYAYHYAYDPIGNRLTSTSSSISNFSISSAYTTNALNQYSSIQTTSAGTTTASTPAYDDDGNMTSSGASGWTYTWDAENRLTEIQNQQSKIQNSYDYQSRRVSKKVYTKDANGEWNATPDTETRFLYNGFQLLCEYSIQNQQSQIQNSYTWSGDRLLAVTVHGETAVTCYSTADANKNISEMTDASGAAVAHFEYDPYGRTTVAASLSSQFPISKFKFRFSSEYYDAETGLIYYNYRYYAPELGRWLSRDPIAEQGGLNLYGFVGCNPVNQTDYLGKDYINVGEDGAVYWISPYKQRVIGVTIGLREEGAGKKAMIYPQYGGGEVDTKQLEHAPLSPVNVDSIRNSGSILGDRFECAAKNMIAQILKDNFSPHGEQYLREWNGDTRGTILPTSNASNLKTWNENLLLTSAFEHDGGAPIAQEMAMLNANLLFMGPDLGVAGVKIAEGISSGALRFMLRGEMTSAQVEASVALMKQLESAELNASLKITGYELTYVASNNAAAVTKLADNDVVVGMVKDGKIITSASYGSNPMMAPSHSGLAKQAGVYVDKGVLSEGTEAFTVIKADGEIIIRGSNNFNVQVSAETEALLRNGFK